jgi:hypothetical protein
MEASLANTDDRHSDTSPDRGSPSRRRRSTVTETPTENGLLGSWNRRPLTRDSGGTATAPIGERLSEGVCYQSLTRGGAVVAVEMWVPVWSIASGVMEEP